MQMFTFILRDVRFFVQTRFACSISISGHKHVIVAVGLAVMSGILGSPPIPLSFYLQRMHPWACTLRPITIDFVPVNAPNR